MGLNRATLKICLLWHRFGPYHHARLRAVSRDGQVTGIEFSGSDLTYRWDRVRPAKGREIITLFPQQDSQTLSQNRIGIRVDAVLSLEKPDIVVVPGWSDKAALAALRWCLARQVPAVVMSPSQAQDAPRQGVREWVKSRIVRLYSAGLCGGRPQRRYLRALGLPDARIISGYNVVDNGHFLAGARRSRGMAARLRKRLGLPARYFLASVRFIPKKNLERLIQAYALYRQTHPGRAWSLVVLGDGALRPRLEALVKAAGLEAHVILPGFKQYRELPVYYGLASSLILPSISEQWGLTVNEAMACGLPVLVSDRCGCCEDLVAEGENGFTFDPFDVPAIAEAMLKISGPGVDLKRMGQKSLEIISHWTPQTFSRGLWKAVEIAAKTGPLRLGWMDKTLLNFVARRAREGYQDQ